MHALEKAVRNHLGGTRAEQDEILRDVAKHGADGGGHNFTYYSETCAFATRHRRVILRELEAYAGDAGVTLSEAVAGFGAVKGHATARDVEAVLVGGDCDDDTATLVGNALAWFALETVAYQHDAEGGAA